MLTVSNELKNAFMKAERTIYVRIKIGNRTFDNDNVVSIEYDSGSLSGEVFAIGSTYSNSIKIMFSELVEGLKALDEVSYEIGIKLSSGAIEYVPIGIFIINDAIGMDRNNNKTTIECMDRMIMMGGTYVSSLTYPAAIREVALDIANKAGMVVDSTSFARLSADKIAKPEGYTYREAIGLIAQFEAGFATFNRYGNLEIKTLSDPNFAIPPDNYFSKGLVKNEVFFRLGGISCVTDYSDTTIQSGNTAGNQVVLENRVMTKMLLDKIYQKIQTINYYPFSLNWQGNPVLEAGDWVVVEDLEGNKFKTPNLSYSLSFNGGLSAKSSAETTTQSDVVYQYKSPLQQKIEWIYGLIDAAGGNLIYEGIDEPSNPKEGDLWFKITGPDKEILIYKKDRDGNLFWDAQISTADINKVAEEVNKIIEQADADRTKAEEEINQALLDAKNYTEVKAQEFDNQLLIVNQNIVTIKNSADASVLKANKAIEDVGFMKIDVSTTKQTAIDALTQAQTATNNVSSLSFNVDELTKTVGFKAEKIQVDAVTRKVDQHTLDISANAQAINARLTSAQVDSLVTGKGYVNQAQLTATSSQWNLALTQVSTDLSNLEIGGRNLLIRTDELTGRWLTGNEVYPNASSGSASTMKALIPVKSGENLTFSKTTSPTGSAQDYWRLSWLNSNKQFVSRYVSVNHNFTLIVPSGVSFLWASYPIDALPKIERGNKKTDWSPAPEDMATLEQYTTLDVKVNGIQTTVGNKADKTEVTQLANQWTQTTALANGHTGQISNLGEQINFRVTSSQVTDAILADKKVKDTRSTNQLPSWYFGNYSAQIAEEFKTRTVIGAPGASTYGLLTTKVSYPDITGGAITQIFSSSDGVYQRVSTSASAWGSWDKVSEAGQLISQINISTEGILLQGKRIQLDGDVAMNAAFVTRLDALTLTAVYADIATLKTRVLTANVITADMLQTNVSIINKLFATDTMVTTLTAKTSFINSVKAIDIAADRITTGNLNAANVNIINLNVSKIVGLNSSFIQSNWNAAVGGGVSIAGGGVVTTASDGAQTLLQNGVLYVKSKSGQGLGTIGAALDGNENLFSIDIVNNQSFTIRYQTATGSATYKDIIGYYDYLGTVVINNATQINGWLRMNGALDMQQSDILAARYITAGVLQTGTIGSILNDGNRIAVKGISGVSLGVGGQVNGGFARIFWLDGTTIYAEKNLSMQKNTITNQSDKRLKKNIVTSARNAMDSMRNWNFVDYEWIDNEENKGVQFGLIAQDTPELMTYGEEHDFYSLDTSRQIMLNSKVGQELVFRTDKHEAKFIELEGKYELLKQKVEKLESE